MQPTVASGGSQCAARACGRGCRGRLGPGDGGACPAGAGLRAQRRPAERRCAPDDRCRHVGRGWIGSRRDDRARRRHIGLEKRCAGSGTRVPSVQHAAQDNERPDEGGAPRPQDRRHHPIHRASPISAKTHDRATSEGCQRPGVNGPEYEGCAAAGSLPRPHVPVVLRRPVCRAELQRGPDRRRTLPVAVELPRNLRPAAGRLIDVLPGGVQVERTDACVGRVRL